MWIGEAIELPNSGRDLMMAVDISGSMETDDMEVSGNRVSRWEAVRQLGASFIDQRRGEDFTCFWHNCNRQKKPFNARYKLLIHMRVHSGERPNKCTV